MRGKADSSDIYPFEVNTQKFVDGAPLRATYAEARADAAKYKAVA